MKKLYSSIFICIFYTIYLWFGSAKIWLLSKREQKRIYAHSTKQQKMFLYLPKNVLRHATNFEELVRAAAVEVGAAKPAKFVDDIFKDLFKIENWIPALSNLKFVPNRNAQPSDENDVGSTQSVAKTSGTPRGQHKRKVIYFSTKPNER